MNSMSYCMCHDVPALETLAAVDLLRKHLPDLKVRVINVVDLMRLEPETEHPHGLNDADFDALSATDKPLNFAITGTRGSFTACLPPDQPSQLPRARLQGRGYDHNSVRHGHARTTWIAFISSWVS